MLRFPITILTTVAGYVGQGLMTFFVASYLIVLLRIRPNAKQVRRVLRFWAKSFLFFTRTRVRVEGADLVDPAGSYVVVGNHTSNLDIPTIMGRLPVSVRFLAKRELFKVPVLGPAMRSIHMIETDRRAGRAAHRVINEQVATVIGAGLSVMIFPEGTRTEDGEMLPFKKGAFRIAVDNDMPVLPVTILGAGEAWEPHSKLIRGGRVRLIVHEPIPTMGLDRTNLGELRDRVHGIVAEPLAISH